MADALRILVKQAGHSRHIALLHGNKLLEYYMEPDDETTLVNAVLLGRVERVLPGMKASFIQIGQPQNGFLPAHEMESFQAGAAEKPLVSGSEVIVQVKKDARDEKGAFLSRDVALPGQYLILMPLNRYIGVSKRLEDAQTRAMLSELGKELADGRFGLVMRHGALAARRDALQDELDDLLLRWDHIYQKAQHAKPPATLWRDPSILSAIVRDYAPRYTLQITCNDAVNRMPAPASGLLWEQVSDIELDLLWRAAQIQLQLSEALARQVTLANGGTLVIDEREALSTIDVNSGKFVGSKDHEVALRQNLAACSEIARQIRLRNLSGIVLIDFIDMKDDVQRAQVISLLMEELTLERCKTVIHGFTSLGLLEMTRKRTGASLRSALQTPCGTCHGSGYQMERD